MWVMDLKVTITLSIYMVEGSNKDQALLMDIRKKDMINIIKVILTFVMIELLDWRPVTFGFCFSQIRFESSAVRVVRGSSQLQFKALNQSTESTVDCECNLVKESGRNAKAWKEVMSPLGDPTKRLVIRW